MQSNKNLRFGVLVSASEQLRVKKRQAYFDNCRFLWQDCEKDFLHFLCEFKTSHKFSVK